MLKGFSQLIKTSERKLNPLETNDWKGYVNKNFNDLPKQNNFKKLSPYTSKGAVFIERLNETIRNSLKKKKETGVRTWKRFTVDRASVHQNEV